MLEKPIWKSITAWGLMVFSAAEAACAVGVLPHMPCELIKAAGIVLTLFGIRRAVGSP